MTTQAIQTRYLGPTDSRGSRVKAFSEGFPRGVTVPYDCACSSEGAHDTAFLFFARVREWYGTWARGGSVDGKGYVYVRISDLHECDTADMDPTALIVVTPNTQEET